MGYYESVFILHPDMKAQEVEETVRRMEGIVGGTGGQVLHTEQWGKRRLAYRVRKQNLGHYVLMQIAVEPPGLRELERNFRLSEQVLKYQNLRIRKEDLGKAMLDREVMEEAVFEAPREPARKEAEEAVLVPEGQAASPREEKPQPEEVASEAVAASPEEDRPSARAAGEGGETDEEEGVSSPEEET